MSDPLEVSQVKPNILIVGAAPESLGAAIVRECLESDYAFGDVATAGISSERIKLDVLISGRVGEVLNRYEPDILISTVGINNPCAVTEKYLPSHLSLAFNTNVIGVMELLRHFVASPVRPGRETFMKRFVAISSNSARIARRNSMAYCASKAALSMAIRVAGRELANQVQVWGYEPGLLAGTPMTREVTAQLGQGSAVGQVAMHRMPGVAPEGLDPGELARRIVADIADPSLALNGVLIPFDAGEQ